MTTERTATPRTRRHPASAARGAALGFGVAATVGLTTTLWAADSASKTVVLDTQSTATDSNAEEALAADPQQELVQPVDPSLLPDSQAPIQLHVSTTAPSSTGGSGSSSTATKGSPAKSSTATKTATAPTRTATVSQASTAPKTTAAPAPRVTAAPKPVVVRTTTKTSGSR